MARDRAKGCPHRWRLQHSSRYSKPERPPVCPCIWSSRLVDSHFVKAMTIEPQFDFDLSRLLALFID